MADTADKPTENVVEKDEEVVEDVEKENNGTGPEKAENDVPENAADTAKTESATEDLSKVQSNIIRQVEYYFGDANLHRDKFLLEQIEKDDGWVPLTVLITFKRLAALSTDVEEIVEALLKSEEGLLEISEDRKKLRRHPERPIPIHNEEHRKELMTRTAYAKGFPLEAQMDELIEFFSPYEKVLNITMRKRYDKADKKYKFKGSVFVTFEKKEQAQSFIEKEELMYKERPLLRKWQESYLSDKREERDRDHEAKKAKKAKTKPEEKQIILPKGTVLHFEGVAEDTKREMLREAIEKIDAESKVAYIEFRQGDKEGHIRFHDEGTAQKFLEKLEENKLKVKDDLEITLRALGDDEETEFLAKVVEDMKKVRNNSNTRKRGDDNRKRRFLHFNPPNKKKRVNVE